MARIEDLSVPHLEMQHLARPAIRYIHMCTTFTVLSTTYDYLGYDTTNEKLLIETTKITLTIQKQRTSTTTIERRATRIDSCTIIFEPIVTPLF